MAGGISLETHNNTLKFLGLRRTRSAKPHDLPLLVSNVRTCKACAWEEIYGHRFDGQSGFCTA